MASLREGMFGRGELGNLLIPPPPPTTTFPSASPPGLNSDPEKISELEAKILDKQCFSFHLPPWLPTDSFEEAKK